MVSIFKYQENPYKTLKLVIKQQYTKRHTEKQHKPESFKRLQKVRKHMQ